MIDDALNTISRSTVHDDVNFSLVLYTIVYAKNPYV